MKEEDFIVGHISAITERLKDLPKTQHACMSHLIRTNCTER